MTHYQESKFSQMQSWLTVLLNTYTENPSIGLAKVIGFYTEKISQYEEVVFDHELSCHYFQMKKFWRWRGQSDLK
ncbi:hypothetical protein [Thalassotalea marina]|uniref:Uncharacterized protein n=1 Tax=Thalassotalea marina TaxID=1673741 RepID=A0A919BFA7_9GAMM|nr:hypothetical protein [Thalassotalea marina]GHF85701.1 hypothetical protein GCM10017161_11620 [Thalassotalea marina]